jgi:hypothetical protein
LLAAYDIDHEPFGARSYCFFGAEMLEREKSNE